MFNLMVDNADLPLLIHCTFEQFMGNLTIHG